MKKLIIILAVTALPAIIPGSPVNAETIIGRWCDRMLPTMPQHNRIITVRLSREGDIEEHSIFGDGSELSRPLQEISGSMFSVIDSPSGDKYRVVPTSGDLQLIDNDGLIRVASRLENSPAAGECGF